MTNDDGVIAEVSSGKLSAVIMFADNKAMKNEPGPSIYPTLDESRIVVSFNYKAFNWRVKKMTKILLERNPEMSEEDADMSVRARVGKKMMDQAMTAINDYFEAAGLSHLGNSDDEV